MYKCSNCGKLYKCSKENDALICQENPVTHIIRCPHCKDETHVIGADFDCYMYGTVLEPAYVMFGRSRRPSDNLQIVEGIKYNE